jgi:hypothetical protein
MRYEIAPPAAYSVGLSRGQHCGVSAIHRGKRVGPESSSENHRLYRGEPKVRIDDLKNRPALTARDVNSLR